MASFAYLDTENLVWAEAVTMGRPRLSQPRDRPLLIRVTAAQLDVLEAIGFLEHSTANASAHRQLCDWIDLVAGDPAVQRIVAERRSYDERNALTHSLSDARSQRTVHGRTRDEGAEAQ